MTALSAAQLGRATSALELVAAKTEGNAAGIDAVLDAIDAADLIQGFIVLVSSLRSALAVAWGCSLADLDEQLYAEYTAGLA